MTTAAFLLNYSRVHLWLRSIYGCADHCENPECKGISDRFEWAKKTGFNYEKNRDHFMQLCRKCHRAYDGAAKRPAGKRVTTAIRLHKALWRRCKDFCLDHDTTMGQLAIDALVDFMDRKEGER